MYTNNSKQCPNRTAENSGGKEKPLAEFLGLQKFYLSLWVSLSRRDPFRQIAWHEQMYRGVKEEKVKQQ